MLKNGIAMYIKSFIMNFQLSQMLTTDVLAVSLNRKWCWHDGNLRKWNKTEVLFRDRKAYVEKEKMKIHDAYWEKVAYDHIT